MTVDERAHSLRKRLNDCRALCGTSSCDAQQRDECAVQLKWIAAAIREAVNEKLEKVAVSCGEAAANSRDTSLTSALALLEVSRQVRLMKEPEPAAKGEGG